MALSAFDDKSQQPAAGDLQKMLGRTAGHWEDLRTHLAAAYAPLDETWQYPGAKWGWSLRLRRKKRTVLHLTPREGHFLVGLALGEKAVAAAKDRSLPESVLTLIDQAPKYAEGRGVRMEIRTKKDREAAKQLAAIKMGN